MASARAKANQAATSNAGSSSTFVDASQHPGFVNLGNTCFMNSTLQAISATQSLRQLYQPIDLPNVPASSSTNAASGPSSRRASALAELMSARSKSPVLQLADEEHGRVIYGKTLSRPGSTSLEASIEAIAGHAVSNPTPADIQTLQQTVKPSGQQYEPRSSDLPLNTAFRQVMEKSWSTQVGAAKLDSKKVSKTSTSTKIASINPKPLLSVMASKYDQYSQYRQQDGHELLRHLLDSLRMEELDVIKKIHPPPPPAGGKRGGSKDRRMHRLNKAAGQDPMDSLKPFVDNLFCGKLLSFVVCEGCRHVSHTYEDFYDISLSLRPDSDGKDAGKRQRIRSMADRWRRSASGKQGHQNSSTSEASSSSSISKNLADSLAILRDGQMGSLSDTEQSDEPVRRSSSRVGRGIARPRSAADRARIDANSKEGAKTFIKRQMQHQSDGEPVEDGMEKLSLEARRDPSISAASVSLLRAMSGRRTPVSRSGSPMRSSTPKEHERAISAEGHDEVSSHHQHHHRHFTKKQPSKQAAYLAKLLTEAPPPPQQANLGALFWGRKTPAPTEHSSSASNKKHAAPPSDFEAQQADTGLVRALNQFSSVEVLDGANSFACKRCWRVCNPPSTAESEKIRLRRLRRGKDQDESEMSSDDESSSDEEVKEKEQMAGLKQRDISNFGSSSATSFTSVTSDGIGSGTSAVNDGNANSANLRGRQPGHSLSAEPSRAPSVVVSQDSILSGTATPTNEHHSQAAGDTGPNSQPASLLKAPKPVVASAGALHLGVSTPNASSDEASGEGGASSDEASDGDESQGNISRGRRSIRYADEDDALGSKPVSMTTSSADAHHALRRKRSVHAIQRRALKRFLIAETPKVFVFHFKRFQATGRGLGSFTTSFKKIDDYVSFPEYLDVRPWLAPPREEYDRFGKLKKSSDPRLFSSDTVAQSQVEKLAEDSKKRHHHHMWGWHPHLHHHDKTKPDATSIGPTTKYRLYAVVIHQGSMTGGHYTAYVLSDRASESLKTKAEQSASESRRNSLALMPLSKDKLGDKGSKASSGTSLTAETNTSANSTSPQQSVSTSSAARDDRNSSVSSLESLADPMTTKMDHSLTNGRSAPPPPPLPQPQSADGIIDEDDLPTPVPTHHQGDHLSSLSADRPDDRRWIFASDTAVRPASIEEVLKAQAYMLFYEQIETASIEGFPGHHSSEAIDMKQLTRRQSHAHSPYRY